MDANNVAELWTREEYEKFLDSLHIPWRDERTVMSCTCDFEDCHGWVVIRHGLEEEHKEEEAIRANGLSACEGQ